MPDQSEEILTRAGTGLEPRAIARELQLPVDLVQQVMAKAGIDWHATSQRRKGRPKLPVLPGQQRYIEAAYARGYTQSKIAIDANMATARVRRHLAGVGLLRAWRQPITVEQRLSAVAHYLEGWPVDRIIEEDRISAVDLYKTLRNRGVALRTERNGHDAE